MGKEVTATAKRFSPKAEVNDALFRVKKLEAAKLSAKGGVKLLESEALGALNVALGKINDQEERIQQLEGALADIQLKLKLGGTNIGVGASRSTNFGSNSEAHTPGRLTGLEDLISKLESNNDELAVQFSKLGIEILTR